MTDKTLRDIAPWHISGSYLEACNCDAICPCRRHGDRDGGRSTTGECQFVLSWRIDLGSAGTIDLKDQRVAMAGWYSDDEDGSPWRVILYVDQESDQSQQDVLADIFLGRAGGTALRNFAAAIGIGEVHAVQEVNIRLDHHPERRVIQAGDQVTVQAARSVPSSDPISCGIPGHDRPGEELVMEIMRVEDRELQWELHGQCGFATDFAYSSDD